MRLHADEDQAKEVKASLSSLPVGTAWVWSPGWLELLRRVQIRRPRTFDSSATPRPGQARPAARRMAPVDLAALGEQIMATVERAKAEDPKALSAAIAGLQAQLDARPAPAPPERIEVPVIDSETLRQLDNARQAWESSTAQLQALLAAIDTKLAGARAATASTPATPIRKPTAPTPPPPTIKPAPRPPVPDQNGNGNGNGNGSSLPKAQRAVLSVLAQHGPRSTTQVAVLTGYSSKSGGFRNSLSALRTAGLITGRGDLEVTSAGLDALGPYQPLPAGRELIQWWKREQLGKAGAFVRHADTGMQRIVHETLRLGPITAGHGCKATRVDISVTTTPFRVPCTGRRSSSVGRVARTVRIVLVRVLDDPVGATVGGRAAPHRPARGPASQAARID